ncbi:MAG: Ig-like domain-containing protein [Lachnospiraceae bacterium]|nr:Ig-like domain-containing protein [Lachnospiraceae bacterium]
MTEYLNIQSVSEGLEGKIKQRLNFRNNRFVWQIKFNTALDPSTVNNVNLFVTNSSNTPLKTAISYDQVKNAIEVEPIEPYSTDETYILNVTTSVKSAGGRNLKNPVRLEFKMNGSSGSAPKEADNKKE